MGRCPILESGHPRLWGVLDWRSQLESWREEDRQPILPTAISAFFQQPWEVVTVMIPILEVKKLGHREVE